MKTRPDKISLTLGAEMITELRRRADATTGSVSLLVRQYIAQGLANDPLNVLREISPTWGKESAAGNPAATGAKRRPKISGAGEMAS